MDSPLNLKHPHDLVVFMRQEATVDYLKELEVGWKIILSNMYEITEGEFVKRQIKMLKHICKQGLLYYTIG